MDWTKEERAIFGPYWNGQHTPDGKHVMVYGDPGRIFRLMIEGFGGHYSEARKDLSADCDENGNPKPDATLEEQMTVLKARGAFAAVAVVMFGLTVFDPATGRGCDEGYCTDLAVEFLNWSADLKKKANPPPVSLPPSTSGHPAGGLGTPIS